VGKPLVGIILVVISAASFGTLAILGRYAYATGMDTITILFLRFLLASIVMSILLVARHETIPRGSILIRLLGMGAIGYVGQAFSYFTALKYASAGLVALLLYLYPTFVALLSVIVLRERITQGKMWALGIALVGTAFIAGPEGGQILGILLAISAALIYSVYIIIGSQVMKQVSAVQSSTVIFASAGVTFGLLMVTNGPHLPGSNSGWIIIALLVLIATIVPVLTFLAALERIGPTNTAMFSTLEPVVTVLLAALLLNERLKPLTLLGGALILSSVLILTYSELQPKAFSPNDHL
jgi:drug/metabolite transporter (DMT)-like permease